MTVYVDDMFRLPMGEFKRGRRVMKMSHMIGTDEAELHAMAARIGVARKWYQGDHYDIALAKRKLAVGFGALEISWRQLACMSRYHRSMGAWLLPEDASILFPEIIRRRVFNRMAGLPFLRPAVVLETQV